MVSDRALLVPGALALGGSALFVLLVVWLHLLQPDYDPQQQLMSELALGPHGGWMLLAFAALAAAVYGVQRGCAVLVVPPGLKVLLLGAAVGLLGAGIFPLGTTTEWHVALVMAGFVLLLLAMLLLPQVVGQGRWPGRRPTWLAAAGAMVAISAAQWGLPLGLAQRLAAGCILAWLAAVGWNWLRPR